MKKLALIFFMFLIFLKPISSQTGCMKLFNYKNIIAEYFSTVYSGKILIYQDSIFFDVIGKITAKIRVIDKINYQKKIKKNDIVVELIRETSYKERDLFVKEIVYETQKKVNNSTFASKLTC